MDSDTALRMLETIAQSSVALAGLMLIATTIYIGRTGKFYVSIQLDSGKNPSVEEFFNLFLWMFIIIVPVGYGLWTAYESLLLMSEITPTDVLTEETVTEVMGTLNKFYYLILYVIMDVLVFIVFLPLLKSLNQDGKFRKKAG